MQLAIGHFRVAVCLCFEVSLGAQILKGKFAVRICLICIRMRNSFPFEWLCTSTRFETEARSNSEKGLLEKQVKVTCFRRSSCHIRWKTPLQCPPEGNIGRLYRSQSVCRIFLSPWQLLVV